MAKHVNFFNCYSINLHRFFKASGHRYLDKKTHSKGISIKQGENWNSYSTLSAAAKAESLPLDYLITIHSELQGMEGNFIDDEGIEYAKRIRHYWIYLVNDDLEESLKVWEKTGPKNLK